MRFSIRDLLWAVFLIALCLAWWLDHQPPEAYTEERVRQWLAKNSSTMLLNFGRHVVPQRPVMDFDEWIVEGNAIPNVEPVLRSLLVNRDPTVDLVLIVMALGRLGTDESVGVLIDCLNTQEVNTNELALWRRYPPLDKREAARTEATWLRAEAASALGYLRYNRAVEPLGKLLEVENDATVRGSVAAALAEIGGPEAINYLKIAANKGDWAAKEVLKELAAEEPKKPTD